MPRQRNSRPPEQPSAIIASATRLPERVPRIWQPARSWQETAWKFYDEVGELRYAANWVGQVLSRSELYVAQRTEKGVMRVTTGPAADAMNELFQGPEGQPAMLGALGVHLTVPGEAYLIGRSTDVGDVWEVLSCQEVRQESPSNWWIDYGDGRRIPILESDVVIRLWRPHPRRHLEADSPTRSSLTVLGEIVSLTRHVNAQITSRLAGAGILALPQSMTFPAVPEGAELPAGATTADQFLAVLGEAMMSPISDASAPSAVVPIIIQVPDETIGKMELLRFWTELDDAAVELRTEAIRRLALSMDLPPEVVTGTGETSHWNAWQIEESAIKVHIEPMLELIASGLTQSYLWPYLLSEGEDDPTRYIVSFDTAKLRMRPNRSREAIELYDRMELKGESLRRETGFTEDDFPDEDERRTWLLRKMATGSSTPDQVAAAMRALGIDVGGSNQMPRQERPAPSLREHPEREKPDTEVRGPLGPTGQPVEDTVVAAADVLVFRALERAGNRLRAKGHKPSNVSAADVYLYAKTSTGDVDELLTDAWSCVPRVTEDLGVDSLAFTAALDGYCRELLHEGRPHSTRRLRSWLDRQVLS